MVRALSATSITWVARRYCSLGIQMVPKSLVKILMQNVAMSYSPPGWRKLPVRDADGCAGMKMVEKANGTL